MIFRRLLIPVFRQWIFWMILFFVCRSIFVLYNFAELSGAGVAEVLALYIYSVRIDLSMSSYLLVFTVLCAVLMNLFSASSMITVRTIIERVHRVYVLIIIALFCIITVAELEIYAEWGTKMTLKALRFLQHPAEVLRSTPVSFMITGWLVVALLFFLAAWGYRKISPLKNLMRSCSPGLLNAVASVLFLLIMPGLLLIGIRGGLQPIPIQQSDAYFSKNNLLNLAAVNSGWNLGQSIWENRKSMKGNPYVYFDHQEAETVIADLYRVEKDSSLTLFKSKKPNVILILLESWSADMIKSLGGYDSAAVHFDELGREGLMFDSIFASGSLSDQGMTAVYSAFPALPSSNSIIAQPDKYGSLPCITNSFHQAGYHTSFLFGGQLSYGNIKAYMYFNRFGRILEGSDFPDDIPRGRLGVHDEYLYARQLAELRNEQQPFFASMFTLSSHSPYDMPIIDEDKVEWGDDENDYVNSVRYADKQLYQFLQQAKKESWYDNTIFIITADHSHRSPRHWNQYQPEYRKIPLLFWGPALNDSLRGKRISKVGSQLDLAATLLNQMNISAKEFKWSRDLLNTSTSGFAFYETYDGFGYVHGTNCIVYSHLSGNIYYEITDSPARRAEMEKQGKSFLQVMFQQYSDF